MKQPAQGSFKLGRRDDAGTSRGPRFVSLRRERADAAHLRWLILGALGVVGACGAKADEDAETGSTGVALGAQACTEPRTDLGGGFEKCGDGTVHRAAVGLCDSELPRSRVVPEGPEPSYAECTRDSDCTAAPYGHCEPGEWVPGPYCAYGCVSDAECGAGYVCRCGSPVGQCEQARCSTDAECGDLLCTEYDVDPGCGGRGMACQTRGDACANESQCAEGYCSADYDRGDTHRECSDAQCAIGRPFLVAGEARLAPAVARCDWSVSSGSAARGSAEPAQSARLRSALAEGWARQGLMEHASVAAFARFSLQLTSLGAPPELLESAANAMLDEIRHARGCFELARRHSDADVGPGPLPVAHALDETDLTAIVLGTIAEGCIGETVAALEAAELLQHTEDPAARQLLAQIAEEEARHAQLAWRFVAWAIETGPAALRLDVARAFDAMGVEATLAPPATELDAELLRHGLASAVLQHAVRQRVLREIVGPCARAMLEGSERRVGLAGKLAGDVLASRA